MPVSLTKYRIKDLSAITQEADLINKVLEVESGSGTDANFQVSVPTLVQTVANNLPGANNTKSAYKAVIGYDRNVAGLNPADATLSELNPDFLCLGALCFVEFPRPSREYRLVAAGNSGTILNVWKNGTFAGERINAVWVEKDSIEDQNNSIQFFNPYADSYQSGSTVKAYLDGALRFFIAKVNLVKATSPGNLIPTPSGLESDANWLLINAPVSVDALVADYLPGSYKKNALVVYNHTIYRAKQALLIGDFINQAGSYDNFPDPNLWEIIGGGGGGSGAPAYNDAPLTGRVAALETSDITLASTIQGNYNALDTRLNNLVSTAPDYAPGSYVKDQLVTSAGNFYKAKQNIQNSQVAPTATNAYWLLLGGGGGGETIASGQVRVTRPGIPNLTILASTPLEFITKYFSPAVPLSAALSADAADREFGASTAVRLRYAVTKGDAELSTLTVNGVAQPTSPAGGTVAGGTVDTTTATNAATTFTLSSTDAAGFSASASASVSYYHTKFATQSSSDLLGAGDAGISSFLNGKTGTLTTNRASDTALTLSNEYTYFAYPQSFGSASFVVGGLPNTAYQSVNFTYTNAFGYAHPYVLYRSGGKGTGSVNVKVS